MDPSSGIAQLIGGRLKAEISRVGMTAPGLADLLGVSKNTVYNWYESAQFSGLQMVSLAGVGIDVQYVLFGERSQPAEGTADSVSHRLIKVLADGGREIEIDPADYIYVPVFDVEFGAGPGRTINFDEPPMAWDAYRRSWARDEGLIGAELFKGTIRGDSMYPILQDRQSALFNASNRSIRSGEIYGVRIGDEHIAKYLRNLPGGLVEISSHNPDPKHAPFTVRVEEFGNGIDIVGALVR